MKRCALKGCGESLAGRRADCRYCSDEHRREAFNRRNHVEAARGFWRRFGTTRRQRPAVRA